MSHWYDTEGQPKHTIGGKNTTLREARKLSLYPSVTTILDVVDKPGLNTWKLNQLWEACSEYLAHPEAYTPEEIKGAIFTQAKEIGNTARDKGIAIHNAFDEYCTQGYCENADFEPLAHKIKDYIESTFGEIQETEFSFTDTEYGYGGCIDVLGDGYVLDLKTKDFTKDKSVSKFVFPNHVMQLTAYKEGVHRPDDTLINVFISTNEHNFGDIKSHTWDKPSIENAWEMFHSLLKYWQCSKKYGPLYTG